MATTLPPTPPSELDPSATSTASKMAVHAPTSTTVAAQSTQHKHLWVITGPAGCGKTSVAEHLHQSYSFPYLEGDTFHTPENVAKMAQGHPLTDADRWDWLILLRDSAVSALATSPGAIVTCSALKRKYRDVLRVAAYHDPSIQVHFIFLRATEAALMDRVRARQNHYMKDYMVKSQFESLEAPGRDEVDVLGVEAGGKSEEVQRLAGEVVERVLLVDGC